MPIEMKEVSRSRDDWNNPGGDFEADESQCLLSSAQSDIDFLSYNQQSSQRNKRHWILNNNNYIDIIQLNKYEMHLGNKKKQKAIDRNRIIQWE